MKLAIDPKSWIQSLRMPYQVLKRSRMVRAKLHMKNFLQIQYLLKRYQEPLYAKIENDSTYWKTQENNIMTEILKNQQ